MNSSGKPFLALRNSALRLNFYPPAPRRLRAEETSHIFFPVWRRNHNGDIQKCNAFYINVTRVSGGIRPSGGFLTGAPSFVRII
jgi:hypothetical protein